MAVVSPACRVLARLLRQLRQRANAVRVGSQTGRRLFDGRQPRAARTARLTPSLVVADFPAFVVVFQTGHGLFIQQRRRERCTAQSNGLF